jgi:hypothetical protein
MEGAISQLKMPLSSVTTLSVLVLILLPDGLFEYSFRSISLTVHVGRNPETLQPVRMDLTIESFRFVHVIIFAITVSDLDFLYPAR